jgi:hypothetical protein
MGMTTFHITPLLGYQCLASGIDQMTTLQLRAAATAAPIKPPTRAWLELLGNAAQHRRQLRELLLRRAVVAPLLAAARKRAQGLLQELGLLPEQLQHARVALVFEPHLDARSAELRRRFGRGERRHDRLADALEL